MSAKPAALDHVFQPFLDAGLRVSVKDGFLMLHDVPVVDENRQIQRGTLIAAIDYSNARVSPPGTHQAWFDGTFPCFADGRRMDQLRHSDVPNGELGSGIPAKYFFSNKESTWSGYATHFDLLNHYWRLITDQARVIEPGCTAMLGRGSASVLGGTGVFRYTDANSSRGRFTQSTERFSGLSIAIVGLGGTGSYVLDHVSKTPVREIHLFDGDTFEIHNAFRAPGAADDSAFGLNKVEYFASKYGAMHSCIVPHSIYIADDTIEQLLGFDFVFVCVDKGPARKLICSFLTSHGIALIDCGMDVSISEAGLLSGVCRATVATAVKSDHFFDRAPTMEESGEALYEANIQISDLNAINALLAVIRWKQHVSFYASAQQYHQFEFTSDTMALTKSVVP
jgi:hypothetical protein